MNNRGTERKPKRPRLDTVGSQTLLAILLVLFAFAADRADADWLVTRDGELIATEGAWRVEGRNVVFIAGSPNVASEISGQGSSLPIRTMPAGALLMLPVSEIDLPQSESETARRAGLEVADEHSRLDPVARKASRTTAPTIRELAGPGEYLEAREDWEESRFSPARVELQVGLQGSSSDNYFRQPEDRPQQEVQAATTSARLTWRWTEKRPFKSYLDFAETQFDDFPSTTSYGAGFRYDGRRHSFDVSSRLSRNRRALDIDDSFEAADMLINQAVYALRSRQWEWRLIGQFLDIEFDQTSRNNAQVGIARTSLLYRGFGRKFAPEVGVGLAQRDSVTESENFTEQELYLRLRFSPIRMLAFHASVRDRYRSYDIGDPSSRNYRREDTQRRWSLQSRVLITRKLFWHMTYSRLQGDSTRAGRAFTSDDFMTGLTLRMGSTSGLPRPVDRGRNASRSQPTKPSKPAPEKPVETAQKTDSAATMSLTNHLALVSLAPPAEEPTEVATPTGPTPQPSPEIGEAAMSRSATSLLGVDNRSRGSDTVIEITADGRLDFSTFSLVNPARFIVDLRGVVAAAPFTVPIANGVVAGVRTEQIQTGPEPVVRVFFDLERSVHRELRRDANSLTVRLRAADG